MAVCVGCSSVIVGRINAIVCDICDRWYHVKCAKISVGDLEYLSSAGVSWRCNPCRVLHQSPSTRLDISTQLAAIKESVDVVRDNLNMYKHTVREEFTKIESRLAKFDTFVIENLKLRYEVTSLETKLSEAEQKLVDNDVVIYGIPESVNENLMEIVDNLIRFLGVSLTESSINDCFRLKTSLHCSLKPRKIILKFVRKIDKMKMLNAVKVQRIFSTKDLGLPGDHAVYIQEHLSGDLNKLFIKVLKFKKSNNYRFAWTSDGNIFLRQTSSSNIFRVLSEADLIRLQEANRYSD